MILFFTFQNFFFLIHDPICGPIWSDPKFIDARCVGALKPQTYLLNNTVTLLCCCYLTACIQVGILKKICSICFRGKKEINGQGADSYQKLHTIWHPSL